MYRLLVGLRGNTLLQKFDHAISLYQTMCISVPMQSYTQTNIVGFKTVCTAWYRRFVPFRRYISTQYKFGRYVHMLCIYKYLRVYMYQYNISLRTGLTLDGTSVQSKIENLPMHINTSLSFNMILLQLTFQLGGDCRTATVICFLSHQLLLKHPFVHCSFIILRPSSSFIFL